MQRRREYTSVPCCTYNFTFDKVHTFGQGIAYHAMLFDNALIAFAHATRVNERTNKNKCVLNSKKIGSCALA